MECQQGFVDVAHLVKMVGILIGPMLKRNKKWPLLQGGPPHDRYKWSSIYNITVNPSKWPKINGFHWGEISPQKRWSHGPLPYNWSLGPPCCYLFCFGFDEVLGKSSNKIIPKKWWKMVMNPMVQLNKSKFMEEILNIVINSKSIIRTQHSCEWFDSSTAYPSSHNHGSGKRVPG